MREEAQNSWKQAVEDLETAEANLGIQRFYASVFFSQQAAEKALKSLYVQSRHDLPPTHNLVRLCRDLAAPQELLHAARELTPDYFTTRYANAANGIPAEMYDEESGQTHLGYAKEIIDWVKKKLQIEL